MAVYKTIGGIISVFFWLKLWEETETIALIAAASFCGAKRSKRYSGEQVPGSSKLRLKFPIFAANTN